MSKPHRRLSLIRSEHNMEKMEKKYIISNHRTYRKLKQSFHRRTRSALKDLLRLKGE